MRPKRAAINDEKRLSVSDGKRLSVNDEAQVPQIAPEPSPYLPGRLTWVEAAQAANFVDVTSDDPNDIALDDPLYEPVEIDGRTHRSLQHNRVAVRAAENHEVEWREDEVKLYHGDGIESRVRVQFLNSIQAYKSEKIHTSGGGHRGSLTCSISAVFITVIRTSCVTTIFLPCLLYPPQN